MIYNDRYIKEVAYAAESENHKGRYRQCCC